MKPDTHRLARAAIDMGLCPVELQSGKAAKTPGWQEGTIEQAQRDLPSWAVGSNVGVLWGVPSGWIVDIDLDSAEAVRRAAEFLPATLTYGRDRKPKSHWLYRCVGARNKPYALTLPDGSRGPMIVEVRASRCQSMFVGSIHPDTGEVVRWDGDVSTGAMARTLIAEIEADDLMGRVEMLATACGYAISPSKPVMPKPMAHEIKLTPGYGGRALADEIDKLRRTAEGSRNHQLNHASFRLHQLVDMGELTAGEVERELMAAAAAIGLSTSEALATIASGRRGAGAHPRSPIESRTMRVDEPREYEPPAPVPPAELVASLRKRTVVDEVREFLAKTKGRKLGDGISIPGYPRLTEALHGLRGSCILTGPTGMGKTTLVNAMALGIASGRAANGRTCTSEPLPVVYVTAEMARDEIGFGMLCTLAGVNQKPAMSGLAGDAADRWREAESTLEGLEMSGMLTIVEATDTTRTWRRATGEHALVGMAEAVDALTSGKPRLVIIDSLATLEVQPSFSSSYKSELEMDADVVSGLKAWSKAQPFGSAILAIHEESKERTGSGDTHAVRGSSKYAYRGSQLLAMVGADSDVGSRKLGLRQATYMEDDEPLAEVDIIVNKARRGGSAGTIVAMDNAYMGGRIVEVGAWSLSERIAAKKKDKKGKPK